MKISEYYKNQKKTVSFEFFPPKTPEGEAKLFKTVCELKRLSPSFVSVTYGAMGNTQINTLRIVSEIKNKIGLDVAAHLTCVAHNKNEISAILKKLRENNIENIVALRGDAPNDDVAYRSKKDGFHHASELIEFIRNADGIGKEFAIAAAGYPEGHLECRDKQKDLEYLKQKVDAGANVVLTQLFFNNNHYFDFVARARRIGIDVPIVPGIMPVVRAEQLEKFSQMCGVEIPDKMRATVLRFANDEKSTMQFGIEYATLQCEGLLSGGAPGLHFYTLNQSLSTREIYKNLYPEKAR